MQNISELLDRKRLNKKRKLPVEKKWAASEWQNRAAEIADYLQTKKGQKHYYKRASVFELVTKNRIQAEAVFRYMQRRKIHNVFYFFKVMQLRSE